MKKSTAIKNFLGEYKGEFLACSAIGFIIGMCSVHSRKIGYEKGIMDGAAMSLTLADKCWPEMELAEKIINFNKTNS